MVAVDTDVVVRLVTNDDAAQAARAAAVFREPQVLIAKSVLLETEWVLRYAYDLAPAAIVAVLRRLLGLGNVTAEDSTAVAAALALFENGLDFADALHLSSSGSADRFVTFDAKLAKRAAAVSPIQVSVA